MEKTYPRILLETKETPTVPALRIVEIDPGEFGYEELQNDLMGEGSWVEREDGNDFLTLLSHSLSEDGLK